MTVDCKMGIVAERIGVREEERDGTAEAVLRDQVLRRKRGQGKCIFPVQLKINRISKTMFSSTRLVPGVMTTQYYRVVVQK